MVLVQEQIPKTPIITIDDAFIGVCAEKANMTINYNIQHINNFKSSGLPKHPDDYYNLCQLNEQAFVHKYSYGYETSSIL